MRRWALLAVGLGLALPSGNAAAGEPAPPESAAPTAPAEASGAASPDASAPDAPIVELITMGAGDDLFEKFGHAAMCLVHDRGKRRTICFNYGTTDFESVQSLVWDFLRGRSEFWVSTTTRGRMIASYRAADRTVWRQILPLSPGQALEMEGLLLDNAREENRYYQYDHYRDNCSSRLRDLIDEVTRGALSAATDSEIQDMTYRELTRRGFADSAVLLLASDLLVGRATDRRPTTYDAMFLPEVLRAQVEARFGAHPTIFHERRGRAFPVDAGMGGRWVWVVLALAFAAPVAAARRTGRRERLAIAAAAIPLALIGVVLWTVALATTMPELRWNEAVLVFLPTDAALPFLPALWRARYAAARVALLAVVTLLLAIGVFHQPLWLLVPMPFLTMFLVALPRRAPATSAVVPELAAPG
ncbi:MAG TPA: DUF4105 domain-containing protein [Kofleriaceae bacterium]|nr:DUF4105 domain-containing protein [Kofleriaceae bacterium]